MTEQRSPSRTSSPQHSVLSDVAGSDSSTPARCWHLWRDRRWWLVKLPNIYERRCPPCRVFITRASS